MKEQPESRNVNVTEQVSEVREKLKVIFRWLFCSVDASDMQL